MCLIVRLSRIDAEKLCENTHPFERRHQKVGQVWEERILLYNSYNIRTEIIIRQNKCVNNNSFAIIFLNCLF